MFVKKLSINILTLYEMFYKGLRRGILIFYANTFKLLTSKHMRLQKGDSNMQFQLQFITDELPQTPVHINQRTAVRGVIHYQNKILMVQTNRGDYKFPGVIGLIAGGDGALRRAVEHAEDDTEGAWRDMAPYHPTAGDVLIGIAASGTTPYVIGGLRAARRHGLLTGSITCNPASPVAAEAEYALEAVVGPEFVTGSTRMKAGTAQKLMLNMLSTAVMIRLGRVEGNRMVNMQLTNDKLVARGTRMVAEASGLDETEARELLLRWGSVKRALEEIGK